MALKPWVLDQFYGGVSDSEHVLVRSIYYQEKEYRFGFAQNGSILNDSSQFTTQPATAKGSGSTITALPKWIVSGLPYDTNTYILDSGGNFYKRTSGGVYSLITNIPSCVGQGMELFNDYIYIVGNTFINRYGPLSGSPAMTSNWQTGLTDTSGLGFAPIKQFATGFVVGHGSSVAFWDGSVWTLAKLSLPAGVKIRSLERLDEYISIGTVANNSIQNGGIGYFFNWDGVSQTFNYYTPMDGGVNAQLNNKNRLLSVAGSTGQLYVDNTPAKKLQKIPKLGFKEYLEIYPGAVCNFQEVACFGVAAGSDSTNLQRGVYQWGSRSDAYPEGLNFAFTISTGSIGSTVTIGALCSIGNTLLIGWADNGVYGIDEVSRSGNPFTSSYLESTIIDDDRPTEDKQGLTIKTAHLPLLSGESIQLGYKINRANSYTLSTANTTVGSVVTTLNIPQSRFKEIQVKAILGSAATTAPTATNLHFAFDDLVEEKNY